MKQTQEFHRLIRQEFPDTLPNTIWVNDNGDYEVFGHYRIQPLKPGYNVFCSATEVGRFNSTRTALSWCIADKFKSFNLARDILEIDVKLGALANDIHLRASAADRSTDPDFRETIATKLETKIIRKKILENQLAKCINLAKYLQQRGFNNETARTGRGQPNKTNR